MAYDFDYIQVLVVESTPEMFELVKMMLTMLGVRSHKIHAAYSYEEGFQRFKVINHDLVITDWLESPDQGLALTRKIRTSGESPDIFVPIIVTAGSSHHSRVIRSRDAGVNEYLVKPFTAQDLALRIERITESSRPFVIDKTYVGPDRRLKVEPFEGAEKRCDTSEVETLQ
ncbi:MAG: response regulator [Rickettsiales bacterium]|nr:response regulator [Rickettsiales bacterium]